MVTELGTPRIMVSSLKSRACTPWNHVFHVASESCARTAAATFAHRSSAAGVPTLTPPRGLEAQLSTGLSTHVEKRPGVATGLGSRLVSAPGWGSEPRGPGPFGSTGGAAR